MNYTWTREMGDINPLSHEWVVYSYEMAVRDMILHAAEWLSKSENRKSPDWNKLEKSLPHIDQASGAMVDRALWCAKGIHEYGWSGFVALLEQRNKLSVYKFSDSIQRKIEYLLQAKRTFKFRIWHYYDKSNNLIAELLFGYEWHPTNSSGQLALVKNKADVQNIFPGDTLFKFVPNYLRYTPFGLLRKIINKL